MLLSFVFFYSVYTFVFVLFVVSHTSWPTFDIFAVKHSLTAVEITKFSIKYKKKLIT